MIIRDIENRNLVISSSPHIHSGSTFSGMMYTVVIALLPAAVFSIMTYGMHAARVMALSVSCAMFFELVIEKLFKRPVTIHDGSAMVTGLLLAMILPPSVPWWLVITAVFISMLVGKHIYGGSGSAPFNAVLVGWAAVRVSWNDFVNFDYTMINYPVNFSIDYPLTVLKKTGAAGIKDLGLMDLFMGHQIGGIGAAAVFLILIGGLILLIRGIISWKIPVSFLAVVLITGGIFWLSNRAQYPNPVFHIVTGNIMIGAFFLATDFSSSPKNTAAMIIFGLMCGMLTVLFRVWSVYPDGVAFAILIMNIFNPLLDKIRPKVRGTGATT